MKVPRGSSICLLALISAVVVLALRYSDWIHPAPRELIQNAEAAIQDLIHAYAPPVPVHEDVVVLGIDDASLETRSAFPEDVEASPALQAMQQGFPWSRRVYADAADKLLAAGASCVIVDVILPGPSTAAPDDDILLAKAVQRHGGRLILGALFSETNSSGGDTIPTLQFPWAGILPEPQSESPSVGYVNYWPDPDGVVRRVRYLWSLGLEAQQPESDHPVIPSLVAAALRQHDPHHSWPTVEKAIRFSYATAYPPLSVHEIFVEDLWSANFGNGSIFKDKIVLIGPAAPHMQDYHATPVGRLLGVQVHSQVLGSTLQNAYVHHAPEWVTPMLIVLLAMAAGLLVTFLKRPFTVVLILLGMAVAGGLIAELLFNHFSLHIPAFTPPLAFLLSGLLGLGYDFRLERKQKQELRSTLSRYFSPDVADELLRDPERFHRMARGTHRTITVLFSDLRGFTTLSEQLPPADIVKQLNQYFERMVEVVFGHQGSIDKFVGDAIMAVWGRMGTSQTPDALREDALNSLNTAVRMRTALQDLNEQWSAQGLPPLALGIGIHQGEAIVGNIGSTSQMQFTAIGDTVNTSARLEGATKQYGVDLLISETVHEQVKERFVTRSADLVQVKGKTIPVALFTVLTDLTQPPPAGLAEYEMGITLYRSGDFTQAQHCFRDAAQAGLNDYLTTEYLKRCARLIEKPPETWSGVYTLTSK
jgi:adenylate cyclase